MEGCVLVPDPYLRSMVSGFVRDLCALQLSPAPASNGHSWSTATHMVVDLGVERTAPFCICSQNGIINAAADDIDGKIL
jgi:hypothetical protein